MSIYVCSNNNFPEHQKNVQITLIWSARYLNTGALIISYTHSLQITQYLEQIIPIFFI